jgi:hypothetical protein
MRSLDPRDHAAIEAYFTQRAAANPPVTVTVKGNRQPYSQHSLTLGRICSNGLHLTIESFLGSDPIPGRIEMGPVTKLAAALDKSGGLQALMNVLPKAMQEELMRDHAAGRIAHAQEMATPLPIDLVEG